MELKDMIFLGACSMLQAKTMPSDQGGVSIVKPTRDEIKASVTSAQRVWEEICERDDL